jgi:hypothetical protein
MTTDEAAAILDLRAKPLAVAMGLRFWNITIEYSRLDKGTLGQCSVNAEGYELATCTLDPEQIADSDELLETLRHEYLHIVLAAFDRLRSQWDVVTLLPDVKALFEHQWFNSCETTIRCLERLLDGNGVTLDALVEKGLAVEGREVKPKAKLRRDV